MILKAAALISLCLLVTPAFAGLMSPRLDSLRVNGFHALYSLQYDQAKMLFADMIRSEPQHPAGYIYLGSTHWLSHLAKLRRLQTQLYNRGNAFFQKTKDPVDPEVEKEFYKYLKMGIARAEAKLRTNRNDVQGLYFLGAAHASIAGYEATVKRSFLSSLKSGSKAVEMHRRVLKLAPEIRDAYLTIGMHNYVMGILPFGVKVLMLLGGVHGSKKEGLAQLEMARKEGYLATDEASVILAVLYDREKKYEAAHTMFEHLRKKYPGNYVFELESAVMLSKSGRPLESFPSFESLLGNQEAIKYMPDLIHLSYADALFSVRLWQRALDHYLASRRSSAPTPVGLITHSHLRAGQCFNALGQQKEAAIEYSFVLKQPNIANSHETARKYLNQPYRP